MHPASDPWSVTLSKASLARTHIFLINAGACAQRLPPVRLSGSPLSWSFKIVLVKALLIYWQGKCCVGSVWQVHVTSRQRAGIKWPQPEDFPITSQIASLKISKAQRSTLLIHRGRRIVALLGACGAYQPRPRCAMQIGRCSPTPRQPPGYALQLRSTGIGIAGLRPSGSLRAAGG